MAHLKCIKCSSVTTTEIPDDYQGTVQCKNCGQILRVKVVHGVVRDVRTRKIDIQTHDGLPSDLEDIISEAIVCCEVGSNAAAVVLTGLFLEGLLKSAQLEGNTLAKMIENAYNNGRITKVSYMTASVSRMIRNIGAHYSPELSKLTDSDALLSLQMVNKFAKEIMESGLLQINTNTQTQSNTSNENSGN